MKNFSFSIKNFFDPAWWNEWAKVKFDTNVNSVEAKIAQARKNHESRLTWNSSNIVDKDRAYRKSQEFKALLAEIKRLNAEDAKKLKDNLWNELSLINIEKDAVVKKYTDKYGNTEARDRALSRDSKFQKLNAQALVLYEMRQAYSSQRIALENQRNSGTQTVINNTRQKISQQVDADVYKWDKNKKMFVPVLPKNTPENKKPVQQNNVDVKKQSRTVTEQKNKSTSLEFDKGWKIKADALAMLMANLDGGSSTSPKVEALNKFSLFGRNKQKYIIGEVQAYEFLKGKNIDQLDSIYQRITWDGEKISFSNRDDVYASDKDSGIDKSKFDRKMTSKLNKFRTKLVERADTMAILSSVIVDDAKNRSGMVDNAKYRSGLKAVIDGTEQEFLKNLSSNMDTPAKQADFLLRLEKDGFLKQDRNILRKIFETLANVGINIGINIATAGQLSTIYEKREFNRDSILKTLNAKNLSARYTGGWNEKWRSWEINVDLAGIRAWLNWNDKQAIAEHYYKQIQNIQNVDQKVKVIEDVVKNINANKETSLLTSEKTENKQHEEIKKIGEEFLKKIKEIQTLVNKDPSKAKAALDAMDNWFVDYFAKMQTVYGRQLKWMFANINLAWWWVGLMTSKVKSEVSNEKIYQDGTAGYKAENLQGKALEDVLERAWITWNKEKTQYKYTDENWEQKVINVPAWKEVAWNIRQTIASDGRNYSKIDYNLVDKNSAKAINVIDDKLVGNEFLKNTKGVAETVLAIRRILPKNSKILSELISSGDYQKAMSQLDKTISRFLTTRSWKPFREKAQQILNEAKRIQNDPNELKSFLNNFLEKSSGGSTSRKLAEDFENNKISKSEFGKKLESYYRKIAGSFARQYWISKNEVMNIAKNIVSQNEFKIWNNLNSDNYIGTIGFSQTNGFRQLDSFNHKNIQIAGQPIDVTDKPFAGNVINKMMASIANNGEMLNGIIKNNPHLQKIFEQYPNKSNREKAALIMESIKKWWFKLKAVLSGVKDAECFNLWFVIEPNTPVFENQNKITVGDTIGENKYYESLVGLAVGFGWKKKGGEVEEKDKTKTTPDPDPRPEQPDVVIPTNEVWTKTASEVSNMWKDVATKVVNNGISWDAADSIIPEITTNDLGL